MQLRKRVNYNKITETNRQPSNFKYRKCKLFSSLVELFGNEQGEQIYQQAFQNNIKYIEEIEEKGYEIVCVDNQMILKKKQVVQENLEKDLFEQYQFEDLFGQNINKYKEQLYYDMFLYKAQEFENSKKAKKQKKNKQTKPQNNLQKSKISNIKKKYQRNSSRDHSTSLDKSKCSNIQQKSIRCKKQNYVSNFNENILHKKCEQINQTPLISSFNDKSLKCCSDEDSCKKLQLSAYESNQTQQLSERNQLSIKDKGIHISEFSSAISHILNKNQPSESSFTLSNHSLSNEESDNFNDQKNIKTKNLNIKSKNCQDNKKKCYQNSQNQKQNNDFICDRQIKKNTLSPQKKKKKNPKIIQKGKFFDNQQLTNIQQISSKKIEVNENKNDVQKKCEESNNKQQKQHSNFYKKKKNYENKNQMLKINQKDFSMIQDKKQLDGLDCKKSINKLIDLPQINDADCFENQSILNVSNELKYELNSISECNTMKNNKDNTKSNLDSLQKQMSEFESLIFQKKNLTRNMYKKLKNSFLSSQFVAPFEYSSLDINNTNERKKYSQSYEQDKSQLLNNLQPNQSSLKVSSIDVQPKKRQQKKNKNQGSSLQAFDLNSVQLHSDNLNKHIPSQYENVINKEFTFQNSFVNTINKKNLKKSKNKRNSSTSQIDKYQEVGNLSICKSSFSTNQERLKLSPNQSSEQFLNEKQFISIQTISQSSDTDFSDESWTQIQYKKRQEFKRKYKTKNTMNQNINKTFDILSQKESVQTKKKPKKNQKVSNLQSGSKLVFFDHQKNDQLSQLEEVQNECQQINFDENQNIFECFDSIFNQLQIEFLNKKDQQNEQEIIPITHSPSSLKHQISNQKSNDFELYSPIKKLSKYNRPIPKKLKSKVLRKHPQINLVLRQQQPSQYLIQFKNPLQIYNASKWFQID
ncbi:hypothetical protein ABPG72_001135 [Tetrahymena utriculariae]